MVLWLDCNSAQFGSIYSKDHVARQWKGELVNPLLDFDPSNPLGLEILGHDDAARTPAGGEERQDGKEKPSTAAPRPLAHEIKKRVAARVKQITADGAKVVSYLDCGVQTQSADSAAAVKITSGKAWNYREAAGVKAVRQHHKDITFHEHEVRFSISGLKAKETYHVNLTWWDYDNASRSQSVWISQPNGKGGKKLRPTKTLPAYVGRKQLPETVALAIPPEAIKNGAVQLSVRCDGGPNAVVGELWLTKR